MYKECLYLLLIREKIRDIFLQLSILSECHTSAFEPIELGLEPKKTFSNAKIATCLGLTLNFLHNGLTIFHKVVRYYNV